MKAKIKYDATVEKDGSMVLTNDLHQKGEVVLLRKIDISTKPWAMEAVVSMTNNKGISDPDGVGGDGIWFQFNGNNLVVGLDTFLNESNLSGNEIVLKAEGEILEQQPCPVRLNSGKKINLTVVCKTPSMITIYINKKPVLSYAFKVTSLLSIFKRKPAEFSMYSFTGDAASTQTVHSVKFKYLETEEI